ncbi:MAG: helix-turn-helix domain-containing protein [Clostridia bacterium]|nr:helix-turn-helix domain-containing protein [Clostridia bacterium]
MMDNVNIVLAANILKYRKKCGISQDELAQKLGVTFQAVSKWENAKSAPDIAFLPVMADIFGCYIDELFSREVKAELHYDHCPQFPWPDDSTIRGVVCEGRKILQSAAALADRFTFELIGDAKHVQSECNIEVSGNVSGGCSAGGDLHIMGDVSGGCMSNRNFTVAGDISGGCNSGYAITVGGSISGGCSAGGEISCGGNHSGDISCGGDVTVSGDVDAKKIKGNVVCSVLKCENIEGDVTIRKVD